MDKRFIIKEHTSRLVSIDRAEPPKTLKGYHIIDTTTGNPVAYAPTEALAAQAIAHTLMAMESQERQQRAPHLRVIK